MQRRAFLILATAAPLSGCAEAGIKTFANLDAADRGLVELLKHPHGTTGAWTLGRILEHATQSVEYSMTGYPQKKSALFRATVGAAAFAARKRGLQAHFAYGELTHAQYTRAHLTHLANHRSAVVRT